MKKRYPEQKKHTPDLREDAESIIVGRRSAKRKIDNSYENYLKEPKSFWERMDIYLKIHNRLLLMLSKSLYMSAMTLRTLQRGVYWGVVGSCVGSYWHIQTLPQTTTAHIAHEH